MAKWAKNCSFPQSACTMVHLVAHWQSGAKNFTFPQSVCTMVHLVAHWQSAEMQKVKTFTLAAFWGPKNLRQKCVIRDKFNAIKSAWFATNWILKMLKKHYLCSKFKKNPEIIFKVQRICNSWIFTPKIAWFATK